MMLDVTDALGMAMKRSWSKRRGASVLLQVAGSIEGTTEDWDDWAGESWGRVVKDGSVLAFIYIDRPLALFLASLGDVAMASAELVEIVLVPSMDAACLRVERSTLERFAGKMISGALDDAQFSAEDLVWATI